MTLPRSILRSSIAALAVTAGAEAAELPMNKPTPAANHVKSCNVEGEAGYVVPGSNTCLKISGDVTLGTTVVKGSKR